MAVRLLLLYPLAVAGGCSASCVDMSRRYRHVRASADRYCTRAPIYHYALGARHQLAFAPSRA
eukprot:3535726-Prymnesium_polylepis.2